MSRAYSSFTVVVEDTPRAARFPSVRHIVATTQRPAYVLNRSNQLKLDGSALHYYLDLRRRLDS